MTLLNSCTPSTESIHVNGFVEDEEKMAVRDLHLTGPPSWECVCEEMSKEHNGALFFASSELASVLGCPFIRLFDTFQILKGYFFADSTPLAEDSEHTSETSSTLQPKAPQANEVANPSFSIEKLLKILFSGKQIILSDIMWELYCMNHILGRIDRSDPIYDAVFDAWITDALRANIYPELMISLGYSQRNIVAIDNVTLKTESQWSVRTATKNTDLKPTVENDAPAKQTADFQQQSLAKNSTENGSKKEKIRYVVSKKFYEVEDIMDYKVERGKELYLIEWMGYSLDEATWEPQENLSRTSEMQRLMAKAKSKAKKAASTRGATSAHKTPSSSKAHSGSSSKCMGQTLTASCQDKETAPSPSKAKVSLDLPSRRFSASSAATSSLSSSSVSLSSSAFPQKPSEKSPFNEPSHPQKLPSKPASHEKIFSASLKSPSATHTQAFKEKENTPNSFALSASSFCTPTETYHKKKKKDKAFSTEKASKNPYAHIPLEEREAHHERFHVEGGQSSVYAKFIAFLQAYMGSPECSFSDEMRKGFEECVRSFHVPPGGDSHTLPSKQPEMRVSSKKNGLSLITGVKGAALDGRVEEEGVCGSPSALPQRQEKLRRVGTRSSSSSSSSSIASISYHSQNFWKVRKRKSSEEAAQSSQKFRHGEGNTHTEGLDSARGIRRREVSSPDKVLRVRREVSSPDKVLRVRREGGGRNPALQPGKGDKLHSSQSGKGKNSAYPPQSNKARVNPPSPHSTRSTKNPSPPTKGTHDPLPLTRSVPQWREGSHNSTRTPSPISFKKAAKSSSPTPPDGIIDKNQKKKSLKMRKDRSITKDGSMMYSHHTTTDGESMHREDDEASLYYSSPSSSPSSFPHISSPREASHIYPKKANPGFHSSISSNLKDSTLRNTVRGEDITEYDEASDRYDNAQQVFTDFIQNKERSSHLCYGACKAGRIRQPVNRLTSVQKEGRRSSVSAGLRTNTRKEQHLYGTEERLSRSSDGVGTPKSLGNISKGLDPRVFQKGLMKSNGKAIRLVTSASTPSVSTPFLSSHTSRPTKLSLEAKTSSKGVTPSKTKASMKYLDSRSLGENVGISRSQLELTPGGVRTSQNIQSSPLRSVVKAGKPSSITPSTLSASSKTRLLSTHHQSEPYSNTQGCRSPSNLEKVVCAQESRSESKQESRALAGLRHEAYKAVVPLKHFNERLTPFFPSRQVTEGAQKTIDHDIKILNRIDPDNETKAIAAPVYVHPITSSKGATRTGEGAKPLAPSLALKTVNEDGSFIVVFYKPSGWDASHDVAAAILSSLAHQVSKNPSLLYLYKSVQLWLEHTVSVESNAGLAYSMCLEASGAMVAATSLNAKARLQSQINDHKLIEEYICLVNGFYSPSGGFSCVSRSIHRRSQHGDDSDQKKSVTLAKPLLYFRSPDQKRKFTLVACRVFNSYKDQILVDMQSELGPPEGRVSTPLSHPLVSELSVWNDKEELPLCRRTFLHACFVCSAVTAYMEGLSFPPSASPLPKELLEALVMLEVDGCPLHPNDAAFEWTKCLLLYLRGVSTSRVESAKMREKMKAALTTLKISIIQEAPTHPSNAHANDDFPKFFFIDMFNTLEVQSAFQALQ